MTILPYTAEIEQGRTGYLIASARDNRSHQPPTCCCNHCCFSWAPAPVKQGDVAFNYWRCSTLPYLRFLPQPFSRTMPGPTSRVTWTAMVRRVEQSRVAGRYTGNRRSLSCVSRSLPSSSLLTIMEKPVVLLLLRVWTAPPPNSPKYKYKARPPEQPLGMSVRILSVLPPPSFNASNHHDR